MIPDINLRAGCSKGVAVPVIINPPESPFATELKDWFVCLEERACLRGSKRNLPKLDSAVCAAGYARIAISSHTDASDFCCVAQQLT